MSSNRHCGLDEEPPGTYFVSHIRPPERPAVNQYEGSSVESEAAYHSHPAGASKDSCPFRAGTEACRLTDALVRLALEEDGPDLTALGVFAPDDEAEAVIVAKQPTLVVGLPVIGRVFAAMGDHSARWEALKPEGGRAEPGETVARIHGNTIALLKAERVILNIVTHLSGVANLTRRYADALEGTATRLLDTRKTLPGQRHLEKYAVRMGGGHNHRMSLTDMLMLKDNHIDAAGSITAAVAALRARYVPCPPVEVECRTLAEVREAVAARPERIMLDNMTPERLAEALPLIPRDLEAEISGGVDLSNIRAFALACPARPADFISVGRITHSAPAADFSMRLKRRAADYPH